MREYSLIVVSLALLLISLGGGAKAQPAAPKPDAATRSMMAINAELMQAWTGARAALIATQDALEASQARIRELEAKDAERFHPIPGPAAPEPAK